jgi:hypothetical protein
MTSMCSRQSHETEISQNQLDLRYIHRPDRAQGQVLASDVRGHIYYLHNASCSRTQLEPCVPKGDPGRAAWCQDFVATSWCALPHHSPCESRGFANTVPCTQLRCLVGRVATVGPVVCKLHFQGLSWRSWCFVRRISHRRLFL